MKFTLLVSKVFPVVLLAAAICVSAADSPTVTVKGYVLDSACAFTKGLSKPISKQCATSCANSGSQLVILADDGMVGQYYAGTTQPTCKLIVMPDCAFAMAGLLAKPQPYFRLQELGTSACEAPGSLREKADAFLSLASEPVNSVAQHLRENEPKFYADTFHRNGGEFVYVVFAGQQDGAPVAYARGFKIAGDGSVNPVSHDITAKGAGGFFAGFNDHIAAYLKAHPHWAHKDTVTTARMLAHIAKMAGYTPGLTTTDGVNLTDHFGYRLTVSRLAADTFTVSKPVVVDPLKPVITWL